MLLFMEFSLPYPVDGIEDELKPIIFREWAWEVEPKNTVGLFQLTIQGL